MLDVVTKAAEKAGGVVKLASALGIRHPSFHSWERVPAERVLEISKFSGVPPHEIRPDIYPAPTPTEAA